MTIPNQRIVAEELMALLSSREDGRMHCNDVYDILSKRFPNLTWKEIHQRYKNSRSHWANRVQFARLSLIEKGYIYPIENPLSGGRNYWTITELGKNYANKHLQSKIDFFRLKEIEYESKEENNHDSAHYVLISPSEPELLKDIIINHEYYEGTSKQITVNVYERNSEAREICIQHYGLICIVCGFNFESVYGAAGKGIIHIHHLKPLAEIGEEYILNPITDLRPVCPNCHAVIHHRKPAYTLEEVRSFLQNRNG